MNIKDNKKAAQGVGTLIIFIALILVAAVAAAVLISTASNLQSSAFDVGSQAEERLRGAVEIVGIIASDASDGTINESTDSFRITLRLSPGSNPVKLEDLYVGLDTGASSNLYRIAPGGIPDPETQYLAEILTDSGYTFINEGYLQRGDLVRIEIFSPVDISERETITFSVTGTNIQTVRYDIRTPSAMVQERLILFP